MTAAISGKKAHPILELLWLEGTTQHFSGFCFHIAANPKGPDTMRSVTGWLAIRAQ